MPLQLIIADAEILDRHTLGNEAAAISFLIARTQRQLLRQHAPMHTRPMQPRAADAVPRLESTDLAVGHRLIVDAVPEGEGTHREILKQLEALQICQLVDGLRIGAIRIGVAEGAAFQRDDFEARLRQFLRHDRTGPAEPDDDGVRMGHRAIGHEISLLWHRARLVGTGIFGRIARPNPCSRRGHLEN